MRIAVFHLGFFYAGGGERLVLDEVRRLRARGHEVDLFAPVVDADRCFPDLMRQVAPRPLIPQLPRWLPFRDGIAIVAACVLIGLLRHRFRSYDVLVGANQPGPWLARVVANGTGRRYVAYLAQPNRLLYPRAIDRATAGTPMKDDYRFLRAVGALARGLIARADRASVRDAAVLLANGTYMAGVLEGVYGRPAVVCAAGADPADPAELAGAERRRGALEIRGTRIERPFVLVTNRHYPQKRFEDAILGFVRWRERGGRGQLVITGAETRYTDELRALVAGLGVGGVVRFLGLVDDAELATLYRAAACYVYPSPEEDFGMGIVEAMANGAPVIACANAGPTGIVSDGESGLLVPPRDTDAFAAAIGRVLDDPAFARRLGQAGHRRARERFSYAAHVDRLEAAIAYAAQPLAVEVPAPAWARERPRLPRPEARV